MKATNIRELTDAELSKLIADDRRELFNCRIQQKIGQLENSARMPRLKREIARCLTEAKARATKATT